MSGAVMRENSDKMQEFIGAIAKALVELLDEDWNRVVFGYFLVGDKRVPHQQLHVDMDGDYEDLLEKIWDDPDYDDRYFDLTDLCEAFHRYCRGCGDDWTGFALKVDKNGRFRAEYDYDPIDTVDRHFVLNWQSRYLD